MLKIPLIHFLFLAIAILVIASGLPVAYAQTQCSFKQLVGKWKESASMPGQIESMDSLKKRESNMKGYWSTWDFGSDMQYRHRHSLQRSRYKRNAIYSFDSTTCEVILGKKRNARERSNLEIIFIDSRYLIYKSDNNPKGYFTHLLSRVEQEQ